MSRIPLLLFLGVSVLGFARPGKFVTTSARVGNIFSSQVEVFVKEERFLIPRRQILTTSESVRPDQTVKVRIDANQFFARLKLEGI